MDFANLAVAGKKEEEEAEEEDDDEEPADAAAAAAAATAARPALRAPTALAVATVYQGLRNATPMPGMYIFSPPLVYTEGRVGDGRSPGWE